MKLFKRRIRCPVEFYEEMNGFLIENCLKTTQSKQLVYTFRKFPKARGIKTEDEQNSYTVLLWR